MRRQPYTDRGISRVPCCRCGEPSTQQWSACAIGNKWMALCNDCDVGLNRVALTYVLGSDRAKPLVERYRKGMK